MPVTARIIMGCMAIFVAWSMIRAAKSGTVFSDGRAYAEADSPALFVLIMIGHFLIILFCLWLAAGFTPQEFLAQFGLGALAGRH